MCVLCVFVNASVLCLCILLLSVCTCVCMFMLVYMCNNHCIRDCGSNLYVGMRVVEMF